ncbi:MAG: AIM24 family protein [Bacteroidetes Order II. Incertae sedis bacterium]|nr:AIM24 family protein [Bacteroidetes Order II. bacterium]
MPDYPIRYRIRGDDVHILEVMLPPGGAIKAESGAMIYMDNVIEMDTPIELNPWQRFVLRKTGENIYNPVFYNHSDRVAVVAFAAPIPGGIIPLDLRKHGGAVICQKGSYLCGTTDVKLDIELAKDLKTAVFGKEGFILQKLVGAGLGFIHGGGTVVERFLHDQETIKVDIASLAAFSGTIHYTLELVKGVINKIIGGEGLWLISLTGPGVVYLQSTRFNVQSTHGE